MQHFFIFFLVVKTALRSENANLKEILYKNQLQRIIFTP